MKKILSLVWLVLSTIMFLASFILVMFDVYVRITGLVLVMSMIELCGSIIMTIYTHVK